MSLTAAHKSLCIPVNSKNLKRKELFFEECTNCPYIRCKLKKRSKLRFSDFLSDVANCINRFTLLADVYLTDIVCIDRPLLLESIIGLFELPEDESVPDDEHFIEVDETPGE